MTISGSEKVYSCIQVNNSTLAASKMKNETKAKTGLANNPINYEMRKGVFIIQRLAIVKTFKCRKVNSM